MASTAMPPKTPAGMAPRNPLARPGSQARSPQSGGSNGASKGGVAKGEPPRAAFTKRPQQRTSLEVLQRLLDQRGKDNESLAVIDVPAEHPQLSVRLQMNRHMLLSECSKDVKACDVQRQYAQQKKASLSRSNSAENVLSPIAVMVQMHEAARERDKTAASNSQGLALCLPPAACRMRVLNCPRLLPDQGAPRAQHDLQASNHAALQRRPTVSQPHSARQSTACPCNCVMCVCFCPSRSQRCWFDGGYSSSLLDTSERSLLLAGRCSSCLTMIQRQ